MRASSSFANTRIRGFTAIELMVTVAILAVLVALAAPSFAQLFEGWRVRQATEQLQSTLYYARSEAIKRGGRVVIQKVANNTNGCTTATTNTAWDCGWFVCEDTNSNDTCDAGEPLLQRYDTPPRLQITRTNGATTIKLNRWGLVDGTWPGFSLVPYNKSTSHPSARGVCMSSGGRIRIIPPEAIPCTD
ncbi:MAG: prepilin-type N-terminal cleavage/methylation domain-containing protein [Burkholderiaceae bacterium]|nr:MAG: prepilin-type N-terminal cleavage/methylation domain-containing protein [Burkholderiaceae bacterium]